MSDTTAFDIELNENRLTLVSDHEIITSADSSSYVLLFSHWSVRQSSLVSAYCWNFQKYTNH